MLSSVLQRIDHFRQQSRVQAGSLIISVFGDAVLPRGGRLWLGSLIGLLQPLGLNERLVRTSVFRLAKDEWLCSEALGRRTDYMLTAAGKRRFEEASRQIYAADAPLWDRRWRLVLVLGIDPKQRDRLRRAMFWQGFGELTADCFVHPSADLRAVFDALITDGMSELLPHLMPLLAANPRFGMTADDSEMVHQAWNLERLAEDYVAFVNCYQPILWELRQDPHDQLDEESAFLLRTLLIHDYRRLLLRDPELPEVLSPAGWPGHQARLLCKEIYRRVLDASERHLDHSMQLANGSVPGATAVLTKRFVGVDPLSPMGMTV
jgi:phenylacetic acid degradation operon negative regulatory protein